MKEKEIEDRTRLLEKKVYALEKIVNKMLEKQYPLYPGEHLEIAYGDLHEMSQKGIELIATDNKGMRSIGFIKF